MGIVNAHTHIYSGLAPLGMPAPEPEPENFVQILERVWWLLDRALDEDSLRASAELYVGEALGYGVPGLVDHHESPAFIAGSLDVIADVCQDLGMPTVLTYGATERNRGPQEAAAGLEECKRFIESNTREMCRGMIGLHASFTVSDQTLRKASDLARHLGVGLHIHVAEDLADVDDAKKRGYPGLIDRLADNGALVAGSIFAHGVHLSAAEIQRCWDAGVWLVQNPRSNQGNKVGYPKNLAASDRVALGTDGYPADMNAEIAALHELADQAGDDRSAVDKRPAAGIRLLTELFGNVPTASAAPSAERMEAIRSRARQQAQGLWQRMKAV